MAVGSTARNDRSQGVQCLRKTITYADAGTEITVGTLPAGAIVLKDHFGAFVTTAFNGGSTDLLDVGFKAYTSDADATVTADPNHFGTAIDISTVGWKECDEATSDFYANSNKSGVVVTATYTDTSGDATAGALELIVPFIADND